MPLISSTPTLSRPTRRRLDVEHDARHRRAHDGEIDEVLRVGADRGADVEHDRFAAHRRPHRRERRALDQRQHVQADLRHRHQRAGVAGRDRAIGLAALDRLDRPPHRGDAPALAQRLARLVGHLHRDVAMDDGASCAASLGCLASSGAISFSSPIEQEARVRAAFQRDRRRGNDDARVRDRRPSRPTL